MHPSPYGSGKGSKDYGKNSSQSGGKGSKDYGKNSSDSGGKGRKDPGSISLEMLESMSDRIVELQRTCDKLKLENTRLKEDYHNLLESERLAETENEIMTLENIRLQAEVDRLQIEFDPLLSPHVRLQAEVDRLQLEFDCMVAANKRLRHGITKHAEQASKFEDSLNELAYPYATLY